MEMEKKYINAGADLISVLFVVILSATLLLIVNLQRGELLIGDEAYYHLRIAENPFMTYDQLSFSGRNHIFNAWHLMLNIFSKSFGITLENASKILPMIFALASLVVFYYLLKKTGLSLRARIFSCIILALSPAFIYAGTVSNDFIVPVFLLLCAFLLLLYKKSFFSYLLILIAPFFGIFHGIITLLFTAIIGFRYGLKRSYFILAILLFMIIWPFILNGIPSIEFNNLSFIQEFISDFGGIYGISIFAVFLSFFGLSRLWEKKYQNFIIYLSLVLLAILAIFNTKSLLYLNFIIAFLASLGLIKLISMKWESDSIKTLSLLIISIGLIFSTVTYMNQIKDKNPNQGTIDAMNFLRENSNKDDIVLSYHSNGHFISALSERKNFMDGEFFFAPGLRERNEDFYKLMYTKDLKEAITLTKKYGIDYIYIDPEMRGKLWNQEDEGILFLLKFSTTFKKIYNKNGYEIYGVE
nr:hypothetical protein [Candidatus Woesearchaeota archaeon]